MSALPAKAEIENFNQSALADQALFHYSQFQPMSLKALLRVQNHLDYTNIHQYRQILNILKC